MILDHFFPPPLLPFLVVSSEGQISCDARLYYVAGAKQAHKTNNFVVSIGIEFRQRFLGENFSREEIACPPGVRTHCGGDK